MKSVEIAGGGIAGLSLGIGLRQAGIPVIIREATTYPRHRLCGEFINGVSPVTLANLGVGEHVEDAGRETRTRWWLGDRLILERALVRPALTVSRWTLDARMAEAFEKAGGELQTGQRHRANGGEGEVLASGRRITPGSNWLGLKAHFLGLPTDGLEMHLGQGGYAGLAAVENGRVNVCGLFQRQSGIGGSGGERLLAYLRNAGLHGLASRLVEAEIDESSVTGVSGIEFGKQMGPGLALGDAERIIPPFTGNGMSMAFEAAECALEPLADWSRGGRDWDAAVRDTRQALANRFTARMRWARLVHGLLLRKAGRDAVAALAGPGWVPFGFLNRKLT